MTQEALKMALDALETELSIDWTNNDEFNASAEKMYEAIAAIKEALAQPERHELQAKGEHPAPCARHCEATAFGIVIKNLKAQLAQTQEPFAYVNVEKRRLEFAHDYVKWDTPTTIKLERIPLYITPPQRSESSGKPSAWVGLTDEEVRKICVNEWGGYEQCRAIEAKLKEKNT